MQRHQPDARLEAALTFIRFREQRQLVGEAAQGRLGLAPLVFARRRDELHQVLDAALRIL